MSGGTTGVCVGQRASAGVHADEIISARDVHVLKASGGPARPGVSLVCSSSRARGRNVAPSSWTARPRTSAMNPTQTRARRITRISSAVRATGRQWAQRKKRGLRARPLYVLSAGPHLVWGRPCFGPPTARAGPRPQRPRRWTGRDRRIGTRLRPNFTIHASCAAVTHPHQPPAERLCPDSCQTRHPVDATGFGARVTAPSITCRVIDPEGD
jgi:hypothetical protein